MFANLIIALCAKNLQALLFIAYKLLWFAYWLDALAERYDVPGPQEEIEDILNFIRETEAIELLSAILSTPETRVFIPQDQLEN